MKTSEFSLSLELLADAILIMAVAAGRQPKSETSSPQLATPKLAKVPVTPKPAPSL
jgi:hypothetical protein